MPSLEKNNIIYAQGLNEILFKLDLNGFQKQGGTDKNTQHSYIDFYNEVLSPFRENPCNLLEIGVLQGGSAVLWHEFLPKSNIYLIDIKDRMAEKNKKILDHKRVKFSIMDAYSNSAINFINNQCPDGFDIIIDDGSHNFYHQRFVAENYFNLLKPGGVLIIEDINGPITAKKIAEGASHLGVKTRIEDFRHIKGRKDDCILMLTRD